MIHGQDSINLCPVVDGCVNTASGLEFNSATNILTLSLDNGTNFTADLSSLDTSGLPHLTLSGTTLVHGEDSVNICPVAQGCVDVNDASGLDFNSSTNILTLTLNGGTTITTDLSSLDTSGLPHLTFNGPSLVHGVDEVNICSLVASSCPSITDLTYNTLSGYFDATLSDGTNSIVTFLDCFPVTIRQ